MDLLAAHISTAEAYNVEGDDAREVNIPTFEPDLSTSFDDPVPWDVIPTGMSDIPTQIYGSADFQSPYYSHMHLVRKPTGKWRYCIDCHT
jgi:hypothetical protein